METNDCRGEDTGVTAGVSRNGIARDRLVHYARLSGLLQQVSPRMRKALSANI